MVSATATTAATAVTPSCRPGRLPSWNAWSRKWPRTPANKPAAASQGVSAATIGTYGAPTSSAARPGAVSAMPTAIGISTTSSRVALACSWRCAAAASPRSAARTTRE